MHFNPTVACKYTETFEIFFQQMKNLSLILKAETELWCVALGILKNVKQCFSQVLLWWKKDIWRYYYDQSSNSPAT